MILRRIGAYIIDYLLILLILTALLQMRFLHPNYEEYAKASAEVQDLIDKAIEEQDVNYTSSQEYMEASYNLQKNAIVPSILTVGVYLLYYVGFTLWTKGQTLGKKAFRIKIVDEENEESLKWYRLLLRETVLYNILFQILLLILLAVASKGIYLRVSSIVNLIANGILIVSVVMLVLRKDKKTIHDFLAKTSVVAE